MDIGAFLKIALYRVVFVLIVGIPAVEVLSFLLFDNGIVIQKVTDETINGSVKLRFDGFYLEPLWNFLPGRLKISEMGIKTSQSFPLEIEIPNTEFAIKGSILQISDPNVLHFGNLKLSIKNLSTIGWVFYLIIAWILGEVLSFLGESLIGLVFFGVIKICWKKYCLLFPLTNIKKLK